MMGVMDCVNERLLMYMGMAYHGHGLWTWYFSGTGKLYYTNCPYEKELGRFFELNGCMDYALARGNDPANPFLMSDSVGLLWLGEYIREQDREPRFVVVGPAFYAYVSDRSIEDSLRTLNLSIAERNNYVKILLNMPIASLQEFRSMAKSLHYSIEAEDTQNLELWYQTTLNFSEAQKEIETKRVYENSNFREQMLLQYVREGNKNHTDMIDSLKNYGADRFLKGNPMRSAKNSMIIFTSQCSRAAIEGGLSVKVAKEMEAEYVEKIEQCRTTTDLVNVTMEMLDTFIDQVATYKEDYAISKPIRLCCAYVKKHMAEPLTLEGLADEIGYSEYYLSRKFQKEMGIKLLDYIKQVRLDYAKILLSTTNLTVQKISEKLQFGTRNYFTRVFKEHVGVSPVEYRQCLWKDAANFDVKSV